MITMHGSPADKMMYYDAQYIHSYSGMFSSDTKAPLPAYYAFKAFGELYNDGELVEVNAVPSSGLKVIASTSHLLVVNRLPEPVYVNVCLSGSASPSTTLRILDSLHPLSAVNWDGANFPLAPFGIALISY